MQILDVGTSVIVLRAYGTSSPAGAFNPSQPYSALLVYQHHDEV
jgi:hypothetical protein